MNGIESLKNHVSEGKPFSTLSRLFGITLLALGLLTTQAEPTSAMPVQSLDDLFTDVIGDLTSRSYPEFQFRGPSPSINSTFVKYEKTGRGHSFEGFRRGANLDDPATRPLRVESRITIELFLPRNLDFEDPDCAWMLVQQTPTETPGEESHPTTRKRRIFARKAAQRGIPVCLIFNRDRYPIDPANPLPNISQQLGYGKNGGQLIGDGAEWMMRKDPSQTPLEKEDFQRMWRHFGISQMYMIAATMAQAIILDAAGPIAEEWTERMKLFLAGGSKEVAAITVAAGVDPRVKAVRFSGSQEMNDDPTCAANRYSTDWRECPNGQHRRAAFANWTWNHRDDHPSFFDLFSVARDPGRYRDKLWIDIVGTADWSNPLGSHTSWWEGRDGLIDGLIDSREERWNFRHLKRPNANHGIRYTLQELSSVAIEATDLLLWTALKHLALDRELPRMEMVSLQILDDSTWEARVRVTGHSKSSSREEFNAWILLSDDRDTRRCSNPIQTTPAGSCFDGTGADDNRPDEDVFLSIPATSVSVEGEFRTVRFTPPNAYSQFPQTPLVVGFMECILRGRHPERITDDVWFHTEVTFLHDELYPKQSCP